MTQYFISYSRENQQIVERLRGDLQSAGINIWIDKIGLTPGTPNWDEALRKAIKASSAIILVASPSSRRSAYVRDEIAIAKGAQKPIYPVWVAGDDWMDAIPMGLGSTQNVDLRGGAYATNLPALIGALGGDNSIDKVAEPIQPEPKIEPVANPRNPYKGLRAFREEDSADFFGRGALVEDLLEAIDKQTSARLLAVLGASGSGKSSVMMAGVLPTLRANHPEWIFLDPIVPSANPLEKLTITLARQFENKSQKAIREDLQDRSTRGLHRLASELSDMPVVLYIDQFEEVFTLVEKEPERRQFIDLLTTAVTESDGVLTVLLSMRADFYDRPLQYQAFGALIEHQHVAIKPMTLADLYDVVQLPAQLPDVGMRFQDDLVT
ncbi:MAG: toll/interleukin-1 receptor domain-containing protein, partial [Chloroflexota bacterium]